MPLVASGKVHPLAPILPCSYNKNMHARFLGFIFATMSIGLLIGELAFAQCNTGGSPTCTLVTGSGGVTDIDKFGICRKITNSGSSTVMVPHNNANEWCGTTSGCTGGTTATSFLQNLPTNVTAGACTPPTLYWVLEFGPENCADYYGGACLSNTCPDSDPTNNTCSPAGSRCRWHIASQVRGYICM